MSTGLLPSVGAAGIARVDRELPKEAGNGGELSTSLSWKQAIFSYSGRSILAPIPSQQGLRGYSSPVGCPNVTPNGRMLLSIWEMMSMFAKRTLRSRAYLTVSTFVPRSHTVMDFTRFVLVGRGT
jgi:hypothetical protein